LQLRFVRQVWHCFDGSFMRMVALLFSGEQHCSRKSWLSQLLLTLQGALDPGRRRFHLQ
jgi:hypothetical protein